MNQKAHCGYERDNLYAHTALISHADPNPVYSKQLETDLFNLYFVHIHPFFPVLDKHHILQLLRFDNSSIPFSLISVVMAVALHFTHDSGDSVLYYQQALDGLDHTTSLATVQTLLLLYKYQEMVTPVGTPISSFSIGYLKEAQSILSQLPRSQQEGRTDEFRSRAQWLLYIILTFGNIADKRWRDTLDYCTIPDRKPELTEIEHYDKNELNTTCNLIQLVNLALVYSPTICLISDQNTLFASSHHFMPDFLNYAAILEQWKEALPQHIAASLFSHQLYSVQDVSKNTSFTTHLCLIHDILTLLLTINQPTQHAGLSRLALAVCYRAHCLTVGDMEPSTFSCVASIQGSRLVSFGLTLALQAQSYCHEKQLGDDAVKNYHSCCALAFQIFERISLSPQLYLTVSTFRTQMESKAMDQPPYITHSMIDTSPSTSSGHGSQSAYQTTNSTVDSGYFYNMTTTTPQVHHAPPPPNTGEWQHYTTYTTHHEFVTPQQGTDTNYQFVPDAMPVTPTFQHAEPVIVDSYFDQSFGPTVVTSSPFHHHPSMEILYDAKSCRTRKI